MPAKSDLKNIPLFSKLLPRELQIIDTHSSVVQYKKEEIIYREGDPPNAFFCILSGRAVVYTQDSRGNQTVLEYLHRGKYFGIISLLTGEPHSVTAKAVNDCEVLRIEKSDFDIILKRIPSLAVDLSLTLGRRLKRKDIHQKVIFETKIISVFSSYAQAGKTTYSLNLSLGLNHQTSRQVILLEIVGNEQRHHCPAYLGISEFKPLDLSSRSILSMQELNAHILKDRDRKIDLLCLNYDLTQEVGLKAILGILSFLVNDYHYIVLDLPAQMTKGIFDLLNQSDLIHLITYSQDVDLKRTSNLIQRLEKEFNFSPEKIKVIINAYERAKFGFQDELKILEHPVYATLPRLGLDKILPILDEPESEYSHIIRRISREIGECLVGLSLGVGGAYGFCHIGVLKVIEEEKIPIDVIAGSSMGALIACLWAIGKTSAEILQMAHHIKDKRFMLGLVDLTLPRLGFIKGRRLYKFLSNYLGKKTFQDLRLPVKVLASDVKNKELVVIDKGSLLDAVMASCSMPGIFHPFRPPPLKNKWWGAATSGSGSSGFLVNGGLLAPLPTEVLQAMGVKKVIAVNVTPSKEDIKEHSLQESSRRYKKTNILELIFGSIEIMQSEIAIRQAKYADVVIHPDTSGLMWIDFDKAEEFAKRGEIEARKNLRYIWQLVRE